MNIILQGVVGSQAYGLAHADSDTDRLGVFVTPLDQILSLTTPDDTKVSKTTLGDLTLHEVQKFLRLCMACNPTILELLFLPEHDVVTDAGQLLLGLKSAVLSERALHSYSGYVYSQAGRLERRGDFDPDLRKRTEKHGRHCWRLLIQGAQLVMTGTMTVRLTKDQVAECRYMGEQAVKNQEAFVSIVRAQCELLKNQPCVLPPEPDKTAVNQVLLQIRGVL